MAKLGKAKLHVGQQVTAGGHKFKLKSTVHTFKTKGTSTSARGAKTSTTFNYSTG